MYKRRWLLYYLILCMAMLIFSYSNAQTYEGKVVSVLDGNTFEVETSDDQKIIFKLWGVDCPEENQPFGEQAKAFLIALIKKKKVTIKVNGKDRKGVRLAEIFLRNGDNVNTEILKSGLGWAEPIYSKGIFTEIEASAKNLKNGLWREENPTPPWIYRRQQSMKMAKGS